MVCVTYVVCSSDPECATSAGALMYSISEMLQGTDDAGRFNAIVAKRFNFLPFGATGDPIAPGDPFAIGDPFALGDADTTGAGNDDLTVRFVFAFPFAFDVAFATTFAAAVFFCGGLASSPLESSPTSFVLGASAFSPSSASPSASPKSSLSEPNIRLLRLSGWAVGERAERPRLRGGVDAVDEGAPAALCCISMYTYQYIYIYIYMCPQCIYI